MSILDDDRYAPYGKLPDAEWVSPVKRDVANETTQVAPSKTSKAVSSHVAKYYHLISPEVIRRLAERLTVGGKKYGTVQWRQGINDVEYVTDRYNHLWEHLLKFQESGNDIDDNLGAMLWAIQAMIEVERFYPEVLKQVIGTSNLHGQTATDYHEAERKRKG